MSTFQSIAEPANSITRSLPFTNPRKEQYGASAAEAVKTSEVVCQLFFLFLSLALDASAFSDTIRSSMTGRRHLKMTLTAVT